MKQTLRGATATAATALALLLPGTAGAAPGDEAVREAARDAVEQLESRHDARVSWPAGRPTPKLVTGLTIATEGADAEARARGFAADHEALLGVSADELVHERTERQRARTSVRFRLVREGLPVLDRTLVVALDEQNRVLSVTNDLLPVGEVPEASIGSGEAREAVRDHLERVVDTGREVLPVEEALVRSRAETRRVFVVYAIQHLFREHLRVLVDAQSGRVTAVRNEILH